MNESLLSDVQMIDCIDIKQVHQHYMECQDKTLITAQNTELIEILGGMNKILEQILLESNPFNLDSQQLKQIDDIIVSSKQHNTSYHVTARQNSNGSIHYLNKYDTHIHLLFGQYYGTKIINALFSITMTVIIISLISVWVIWAIIQATNSLYIIPNIGWQIYLWIHHFITISYGVLVILSVNRKLFRKLWLTFDFIIRFIYGLRIILCEILITIHFNFDGYRSVFSVVKVFMATIVVCCSSVIDGLPITFKIKIILLGLVAILYTFITFRSALYLEANYGYTVHLSGILSVNLQELNTSSYRIIALFAWKQFYISLRNRHTATTITQPVQLRWINY